MLSLLPLAVTFAAGLASAARAPLLAYHSPGKGLSGLEQGAFQQTTGTIMWLPSFHRCGILQLLHAEDLRMTDFALLPFRNETAAALGEPTGSGLKEAFAAAAVGDKDLEEDAREEEVLVWAKGWARSCGKGAAMKEVRVAKVAVDWSHDSDREEGVRQLDASIAGHLASLPPAPHPHLLILTTFSPSTLLTLFDIAASTSHPRTSPSPSPDQGLPEWPARRRRHHGAFRLLVVYLMKIGVLAALAWGGWRLWEMRQKRKQAERGIRLGDADELDLEAE